MALISSDIAKAIDFLKDDVVAIPTETVYGLAANALSPHLVARIFEVKNRPFFDPLIVHVASIPQVSSLVSDFPEVLRKLAEQFWPGPLTLLLPRTNFIPDIVTSGLPRVGIRIPNHPLTRQLLERCRFPLAAPSANPFGYISPTRPEHVQQQLGDLIPMILDGGDCEVGLESTIVGIEDDVLTVYRLGGIPIEDIQAIAGSVVLKLQSGSNPGAPGMLHAHYAPSKPVYFDTDIALYKHKKIFLIRFNSLNNAVSADSQVVLSSKSDLSEAAVRLFEALHIAEKHPGTEIIVVERVPDEGIGRAINDRLQRAAQR